MEGKDIQLLCCVFCIVGVVVKLVGKAIWNVGKLLLWTIPKAIYKCYKSRKHSADNSSVDGQELRRDPGREENDRTDCSNHLKKFSNIVTFSNIDRSSSSKQVQRTSIPQR
jgi:hypothetical protein